ncbi:MAG: diguanylate cyclase [Deltaproteobacteria bacterium]|nr:diguanylate cyclase [Candidatus Anaeroferrophillacea bacterium]
MPAHYFSTEEMERFCLDLPPDIPASLLQEKAQTVNLLLKAPLYLASSDDRGLIIEMFASLARKIIRYSKAAYCTRDDGRNAMEMVFQRGFNDSQASLLSGRRPFAAMACQYEKPLLVREPTTHAGRELFDTLDIAEALIIPVSWNGMVRANWQLFANRPGTFTMDDIQLFWVLTMQCEMIFHHLAAAEPARQQTYIDPLTGLFNRHYFDHQLAVEFDRSQRQHTPLSLLMLDIDNFRQLNERFSHQAGDRVLQEIGRLLRRSTRRVDIISRHAGEEFSIILPHTDHVKAYLIGERIRRATEKHLFPVNLQQPVGLTVSIGIAAYPETSPTPADLVRHADAARYEAKRLGRNQSTIYTPQQTAGGQLEGTPRSGLDRAAIDRFAVGIRTLDNLGRLGGTLLASLLPRLGKPCFLFLAAEPQAGTATLVLAEKNGRACETCREMPLDRRLSERLRAWTEPGLMDADDRHLIAELLIETRGLPWERPVYRHPYLRNDAAPASLMLFLPPGHADAVIAALPHENGLQLERIAALLLRGVAARRDRRDFDRRALEALISFAEASLPSYGRHSRRTSRLLNDFGRHLDLAPETCRQLADTAFFYDIGMMGIDRGILLKKQPLTDDERSVCRQHPRLSWEIAKFTPGNVHPDRAAILHHHENFDGSGYPEKLSGTDIPLTARILALVDSYMAMTAPRPYRPAKSKPGALEEIDRLASTRFDPGLAREFCSFMEAGHA